jgi:hypothetical protein
MCVIMVIDGTRPTDEMIEKAWHTNDDGGGVAWRQKNKQGEVEVRWIKGIETVEEMKKLIAKVPMPAIAHFRIASVGGALRSLTHPFPIEKDVPLNLNGATKGGVLFHNGHWGAWSDKALDAAIGSNTPIPPGDWSDTRAMAWLTSIYGDGFMEFLPEQRGVLLSPTEMNIFTGKGWYKINEVWCSNDIFWTRKGPGFFAAGGHTNTNYGSRVCSYGTCRTPAQAGRSMCAECEKKSEGEKKVATTTLTTTTSSTSSNSGSTTKIGSSENPPFEIGASITLKQAEILHRGYGMSKTLFKKIRRELDLAAGKGKRAERAQKALALHTETARRVCFRGQGH